MSYGFISPLGSLKCSELIRCHLHRLTKLSCGALALALIPLQSAQAVPSPAAEPLALLSSRTKPASCLVNSLESTSGECSWELQLGKVFRRLYPEYLSSASDRTTPHSVLLRSSGAAVLLVVVEEELPNAFAVQGELPRLFITSGLLALLQNENELAFILAHEMAHITSDHFAPDLSLAMLTPRQLARIEKVHEGWELDADRQALSRLERAGYGRFGAAELLSRLAQYERPEEGIGRRHPAIDQRVRALQLLETEAPDTPQLSLRETL